MKWLIGLLLAGGFVGGGMYLHGDMNGGDLYMIDQPHAMQALTAAPLPTVLDSVGLRGTNLRAETVDDNGYQWRLTDSNNKTIATVTATLKSNSGDSTRVYTSFAQGDAKTDSIGEFDGDMAIDLVKTLSMAAMHEQLESTLNHHDYNDKEVKDAQVAFIMKHAVNGDIMREGLQRQADFMKAQREAEKASINNAYNGSSR